jgi:hypothetical protein
VTSLVRQADHRLDRELRRALELRAEPERAGVQADRVQAEVRRRRDGVPDREVQPRDQPERDAGQGVLPLPQIREQAGVERGDEQPPLAGVPAQRLGDQGAGAAVGRVERVLDDRLDVDVDGHAGRQRGHDVL